MLRALFTGLFLFVTALAAHAQDVLAPNPDIEATIGGQFDAFRAGDVAEA